MSNKGDVIAFMLITYGSLFCGWGLDVACRKMMGFTKKENPGPICHKGKTRTLSFADETAS